MVPLLKAVATRVIKKIILCRRRMVLAMEQSGAEWGEDKETDADDEDLDPEEEIMMRTFPPYPYRVRDDLTDLVSDELQVLNRLPSHRD